MVLVRVNVEACKGVDGQQDTSENIVNSILTLKVPENLNLFGLYVYCLVQICDFGMLRVKCVGEGKDSLLSKKKQTKKTWTLYIYSMLLHELTLDITTVTQDQDRTWFSNLHYLKYYILHVHNPSQLLLNYITKC